MGSDFKTNLWQMHNPLQGWWGRMDVGAGVLSDLAGGFFCAGDGCLIAFDKPTDENAGSVLRFCPAASRWELFISMHRPGLGPAVGRLGRLCLWQWSFLCDLRQLCAVAQRVHWPVGETAPAILQEIFRYPVCGGRPIICHWRRHSVCGGVSGNGAAVGVRSGYAHSSC